jgi:acetyltransferase-like isoleucine patch superfamily enzyme
MGVPTVRAARAIIAPDVVFGEDVVIEAESVEIGPGSAIGVSELDGFRTPEGVRIRVNRLQIGTGSRLDPALRLQGGVINLGDGVRIGRNSTIDVADELTVGDHGTIGESCEIRGRSIRIGQELWMLPYAKIGGGSAYEVGSSLDAGHYLHLGLHTFINTARPVVIGHEVGLGTRTSIYTHGAYPSRLMGFPVAFDGVSIGDFTWIPGATINPGVEIGRNCVIGVNSLVTTSIPDGALAAGSPAKVIREDAYPRPLEASALVAFYASFLEHFAAVVSVKTRPIIDEAAGQVRLDLEAAAVIALVGDVRAVSATGAASRSLVIGDGAAEVADEPGMTRLDTRRRRIDGLADPLSDRLINELRRFGIRFYSRPADGRYVEWEKDPPSSRPS